MDGQTHLVLIREEAGAPDAKVRGEGSGMGRQDKGEISGFPGLSLVSVQRSGPV